MLANHLKFNKPQDWVIRKEKKNWHTDLHLTPFIIFFLFIFGNDFFCRGREVGTQRFNIYVTLDQKVLWLKTLWLVKICTDFSKQTKIFKYVVKKYFWDKLLRNFKLMKLNWSSKFNYQPRNEICYKDDVFF